MMSDCPCYHKLDPFLIYDTEGTRGRKRYLSGIPFLMEDYSLKYSDADISLAQTNDTGIINGHQFKNNDECRFDCYARGGAHINYANGKKTTIVSSRPNRLNLLGVPYSFRVTLITSDPGVLCEPIFSSKLIEQQNYFNQNNLFGAKQFQYDELNDLWYFESCVVPCKNLVQQCDAGEMVGDCDCGPLYVLFPCLGGFNNSAIIAETTINIYVDPCRGLISWQLSTLCLHSFLENGVCAAGICSISSDPGCETPGLTFAFPLTEFGRANQAVPNYHSDSILGSYTIVGSSPWPNYQATLSIQKP